MLPQKINKKTYPSDVQPISGMNVVDSRQSLANPSNAPNKNNITYNIMNKNNLSKLTKKSIN